MRPCVLLILTAFSSQLLEDNPQLLEKFSFRAADPLDEAPALKKRAPGAALSWGMGLDLFNADRKGRSN